MSSLPQMSPVDQKRFLQSDYDRGVQASQLHNPSSASEAESINEVEGSTKRQKLRNFSKKAKQRTKNLLHADGGFSEEGTFSKEKDVLSTIKDDPAFNPKILTKHKSSVADGFSGNRNTPSTLRSVAKGLIHPKDAIKGKATKTIAYKLSQAQRPYLSQEADQDLLNAHDDLDEAYSSRSLRNATSDEEADSIVQTRRNRVKEIEAHRESLRAAWTTSRHVSRVRVVPKRQIDYPIKKNFAEKDSQGRIVRYEWLRWLGCILIYYTQDFCTQYIDDFDELPFDIDSLRRHVERVVMACEPWQSWAMHVRSVYRWEHPRTTGRWLGIYMVLWYTDHIIGFVWFYIIYIVINNYFYPTSVGSLQDSAQRALDSQATAHKFGELVDKHGRDNWLNPVIDELGPSIQLQVGDIANMLEVISNFYHWKSPRKTAASLILFAACLLLSVFADMAYCVRIVGFVAGGGFFLCWPIASLYPKYRYLVSPFKWMFWDIPTDAEWSFQYLRRQAQITRECLIQSKVEHRMLGENTRTSSATLDGETPTKAQIYSADGGIGGGDDDENEDWQSANSSSSILDTTDLLAFRAKSPSGFGRLVIYPGGIRFVRSVTKKELWRRTFLEMVEMRKLEGSTVSKLTNKALEQLEFTFTDGETLVLKALKDRDEAFNAIIGFSYLQWQVLQTNPRKAKNSADEGERRNGDSPKTSR